MRLIEDFKPAASKAWSVEFNSNADQTGLTVTAIDGQSMDRGMDVAADPAMGAKLDTFDM